MEIATSGNDRVMWTRSARQAGVAPVVVAAAAATLAPAAAQGSVVGLSATAEEPSACFEPSARTASTHCQLFAGTPLRIVANASDEDGMTRLAPQPFTLERLARGRAPVPVVSWTTLDDDDSDDRPLVTPDRTSDYQARFGGNEGLAPGISQTLVAEVGVRIAIPSESRSGASATVRIPVTVALRSRAQRGRLELRRCRDALRYEARDCAGRRGHDVVATRTVRRAGRYAFAVRMAPRTQGSYEVAYRPAAGGRYAVTRQAFRIQRGYDDRTSYRYTVRRDPFGRR